MKPCDCGNGFVLWGKKYGMKICTHTLEKYKALYGKPEEEFVFSQEELPEHLRGKA